MVETQEDVRLDERSQRFISKEATFGDDTVIIHTWLACERLLVKHCSKGTHKVLGFESLELVECDITTIMPEFFRAHHLMKLAHWMD